MSPDDVNDISRSQLRCKTVYPENDVYGDVSWLSRTLHSRQNMLAEALHLSLFVEDRV